MQPETLNRIGRQPWLRHLLLFFTLALIFQIETLATPPRSDSAAYLYIGARQSAGQMPGRDLWDNKLPLIYLVGRAAMATGSPRVFLWLIEAALTALGALAVRKLVQDTQTHAPAEAATKPVREKSEQFGCPAPSRGGGLSPALSIRHNAPARACEPPSGCPAPSRGGGLTQALSTRHRNRPDIDITLRNRPGLAAGILLCIICGAPSYHAGGFMTEVYAMPLSALAALLSWRSFTRAEHTRHGIAAGLCWAVAVSFRLPLALAAAGVVACCLVTTATSAPVPESRRPPKLACLSTHVIGVLLGLLIVFAHPAAAGYLRDSLNAAILWPLGLTGDHTVGPLTLTTAERLADFAQDIAKLGWLHAAAITGFILSRRSPSRRLAPAAAVWYVTATASAALGWASYAHYQYVALAPICVGCGLLLNHLRQPLARRLAVGITALTAVVICTQNVRELTRPDHRSTDAQRRAVVEYIHTTTDADESVYIWAWNRSADLLYRIDRPPGNRHFMAHAYFNMDLSLFDEMVETFVADPPTRIVIDRNRSKPALIGPLTAEWKQTTPSLQRLRDFVQRQYQTEAQFGQYVILRLSLPAIGVDSLNAPSPPGVGH